MVLMRPDFTGGMILPLLVLVIATQLAQMSEVAVQELRMSSV